MHIYQFLQLLQIIQKAINHALSKRNNRIMHPKTLYTLQKPISKVYVLHIKKYVQGLLFFQYQTKSQVCIQQQRNMSQSRKSKKIQKQSSTARASSYSAVIGYRRTLRGKENRVYKINPQPMYLNESKKTMIFLLDGNDGNQYVGKFIKLQRQIQAITQVYYLDKLKGKHICNMIDLVKNNEGIWIICQKGHTSLHSYLKNLRQEQVQVILRNIAIAYLPFYQSGTAHRDLKPGNIIIQQNLDAKLIDLQLCQKTDQRYGTLSYIPPHLKAIMWDSSDSYAYGLIAKQMAEKCFHFNQSLQQLIHNCVQSERKWGWKEIYAFWGIDTNQQGMSISNNNNDTQ